MILNRAREEVEMITLELARTNPDLGFLIVHAESLASVLKTAVDLRAFKLSDPEDQLLIRAYAE